MSERRIAKIRLTVAFGLCFTVLLICTLALGSWLLFAFAFAYPPSARILCFFLEILALILYFRWPWFAALVGWLNIGLALTKVFPWTEPGFNNFIYQFSFDLIYCLAAQIAVFLNLARQRVLRS